MNTKIYTRLKWLLVFLLYLKRRVRTHLAKTQDPKLFWAITSLPTLGLPRWPPVLNRSEEFIDVIFPCTALQAIFWAPTITYSHTKHTRTWAVLQPAGQPVMRERALPTALGRDTKPTASVGGGGGRASGRRQEA